jgi:hypothetical protein
VYDKDGGKSVVEGQAGASGTAGDDILINRFGSIVDGGDGDDIIVNFASDATILGGNGNDTILAVGGGKLIDGGAGDDLIAADRLGGTIRMGEGSDRLVARAILGSRIESSGNDSVAAKYLNANIHSDTGGMHIAAGNSLAGTFILGDADNTIRSQGAITRANIKMGNGNNSISGDYIEMSRIDAGNGNNALTINHRVNATHLIEGLVGNINGVDINFGDGNNTIRAAGMTYSAITVGNGNNTLDVNEGYRTINTSIIEMGNGENSIATGDLSVSDLKTGDGNDHIRIGRAGGSSIQAGGGDDAIEIDESYLSTVDGGDGNDAITIKNARASIIAGGNGDDALAVANVNRSLITGDAPKNEDWQVALENFLVGGLARSLAGGDDSNDNLLELGNSLGGIGLTDLFVRWATRAADTQSEKQAATTLDVVSTVTENADALAADREPEDVHPDSLGWDLSDLDAWSAAREARAIHLSAVKNLWNPDSGADARPEGGSASVINSVIRSTYFSGDNT